MADSYVKNSGLIGLSNLVFAIMTNDDSTGTTYGEVQKMGEAITVKVTPKVANITQYGDDTLLDQANELQSIDLEIGVNVLPLSVQAALLGHTIENGVMQRGVNDVAPYVAVGYKRLKMNNKYRYTWLYKGLFAPVTDEGQTKDDKPAVKTATLTASFIPRISDGLLDISADEEEPTFTTTTASTWFDAVPSSTTTA